MSDDRYDAALDLLRRLDPKNIHKDLATICQSQQDLAEELLTTVDVPLTVKTCSTGAKFLCCDFNRDGDSYKSPFTGEYQPAVEDAPSIPEHLRALEVQLNSAFDTYRELYFDGGICSCYLWEAEAGFAGVVLIKKQENKSFWDSIHVFEVEEAETCTYSLTSTIILGVGASKLDLTGNLTRQATKTTPKAVDDWAHIGNIGSLVEETESKLRSQLNEIYFGKTKDIIGEIRSVEDQAEIKGRNKLEGEVARGTSQHKRN